MELLILFVGILIGILISGGIFTAIIMKNDDYIHQLEDENENLKERNARLKENIVRNNYD